MKLAVLVILIYKINDNNGEFPDCRQGMHLVTKKQIINR